MSLMLLLFVFEKVITLYLVITIVLMTHGLVIKMYLRTQHPECK